MCGSKTWWAALGCASLLAAGAAAQHGFDRAARARQLRARGDARLAAADRGSAIGWYRDALDADPSDGPSYEALGRIYLERGALDDARAVLEAGVRNAPDHTPIWRVLAEVLERGGALDEAARVLRELVRRTPRDSAAWRARAELARRRGAFSEALACYRAILALADDGVSMDPSLLEEASRSARALALLVGTLDPVRRARSSSVRRAIADAER